MEKISKYIAWIVILGLFIVVGWTTYQLEESKDNVREWQNKVAAMDSVHVIDSTAYSKQSLVVGELVSDNERLNEIISDKDGELAVAASTELSLNLQIEALETKKYIDTVYVTKDSTIFLESRSFEYDKHGLVMNGYFNLVPPYLLFVNNFSFTGAIDIGLIGNEDGTWEYLIETNNKYLKVGNVNVKVLETYFVPRSNFGYLGGAGYYISPEYNALTVSAGIYYKQFDVVGMTIFNGTPNISLNVLYRSK